MPQLPGPTLMKGSRMIGLDLSAREGCHRGGWNKRNLGRGAGERRQNPLTHRRPALYGYSGFRKLVNVPILEKTTSFDFGRSHSHELARCRNGLHDSKV